MNTTKQKNAITGVLALLVAKNILSGCRVTANISVGASRKQAPFFSSLQSHPDPHHLSLKMSSAMPTIPELVGGVNSHECSEGLVVVEDSIDPSFHEKEQRNIPKVIHMTGKSRCMTRAFAANVDSWRFKGYSLFLHDDNAVGRLLNRWWPKFPHILDMKNCMMPGAAIADLWRYVLLWEYGGVYTDIDNAPGPWFWNETGSVITNTTDALFEQEKDGFPSQYFFAAAPHHPIMYLAVQNALLRLMEVQSVRKQYVPFVTGPGAIKSAVVSYHFLLFWLLQICLIT